MNITKSLECIALSPLLKPLVSLSGNSFFQTLLLYNLHITQHLMGIGFGSSVNTSGEYILSDKLRRLGPAPLTVFDVGANQGKFTTMLLSRLLKRKLVIHAFEPSATAFAALSRHNTPTGQYFTEPHWPGSGRERSPSV